jgi:hypothetical protein
MLQRRKEAWLIATCVFANMIVSQPSFSSPIVLRKEPALLALVPTKAFDGVGSWFAGGYYIATGYSTSAESLGAERQKGIEEKFAEKDAKARIGHEAALHKNPQFDEESYTCRAEISGFRVAATYKLGGRDGLFVIGMTPEDAVSVNIVFDSGSARRNALAAFNAGDYGHAARLLAGLTERGIQDPEIIALARAASAGVNLVAGVTGTSRMAALRVLADYYFEKADAEEAVQFYYRLYGESNDPNRIVLERLAELCAQTHRDDNAKAFRKEVSRLWPEPVKP